MNQANVRERQVRRLLRISAASMTVLAALALYGLWRSSQRPQRVVPLEPIRTWGGVPVSPDGHVAAGTGEAGWSAEGIADFELIDQHGRTVTNRDLLGRPWVVCFIFTRCAGKCPVLVRQIDKLDKQLKEIDVRFVAISVDPEHDRPEVLARYAELYKADSDRWLFLTGGQAEIHKLIRESFLMPVAENEGKERIPGFEFAHTLSALYVDAAGRVVRQFDPQSETDLVRVRRMLLEEVAALER